MATDRQIAANRLNGLKGGVKTPEGKAISCMNARKHGIFAAALTEHDAEGLRELLDELAEQLKPVGTVERLLVDKLAVTYLRMQRCARAETLHYRWRWNSSFGQPGQFEHDDTVVTIGLYDARLTNQFLRLLHEIEARQRARLAQPPATVQSAQAAPAPGVGNPEALVLQMKNEPNLAASVAQPLAPQPATARTVAVPGASRALTAPTAAQSPQAGPGPGAGDRGAPERQTEGAPEKAPVPQVKNEPNSAGVAQPEIDAILGIEHSSCKIPPEPLNSCVRSS